MTFITPVERIPPLIVLVGGRVDAEGAVRIAFRVVFLGELDVYKRQMQGNTAGMGQENGFWGERQQEAF